MALSKTERKAMKDARRAAREEAKEEVIETKLRVVGSYAVTYVVTQALPALIPGAATAQKVIDGGLAVVGGYVAFTNDDEVGDFALGAALVGAIQTLDNLGAKLSEWLGRNRQAA